LKKKKRNSRQKRSLNKTAKERKKRLKKWGGAPFGTTTLERRKGGKREKGLILPGISQTGIERLNQINKKRLGTQKNSHSQKNAPPILWERARGKGGLFCHLKNSRNGFEKRKDPLLSIREGKKGGLNFLSCFGVARTPESEDNTPGHPKRQKGEVKKRKNPNRPEPEKTKNFIEGGKGGGLFNTIKKERERGSQKNALRRPNFLGGERGGGFFLFVWGGGSSLQPLDKTRIIKKMVIKKKEEKIHIARKRVKL